MQDVTYREIMPRSAIFDIETDEANRMITLRNPQDPHRMNWVNQDKQWGKIKCGLDLSVDVKREYSRRDTLVETYTFKNTTKFDIYTVGTQLGIYTPFPDYYSDAQTCLTQCCNTHIWCGGDSSYIMALRMGGEAPHLGLILRKGSLKGYSIDRNYTVTGREENVSNHRGDFILHPENLHLRPNETYTLQWELFWFKDKQDFRRIIHEQSDFITVSSRAFLTLGDEPVRFTAHIGGVTENGERPEIYRDGKPVPFDWKNGTATVAEQPNHTGEYNYEITWRNKRSRAAFLVMPPLETLTERRCRFIVEHQQCHDQKSHLNGAYLIYDNEEKQQYYGHLNDHNGGRERVGMGVLLALYLQHHPNSTMQKSLDTYVDYVVRELFDPESGTVYNDVGRNNDDPRLYNYPWISILFLEMYKLKNDDKFLTWYAKSVEAFYKAGGGHFYAIGMPMYESINVFREAGWVKEAERLLALYKRHVDYLVACGQNYPQSEVDYEQGIVAPAAAYIRDLYRLTDEEQYRKATAEQLRVLDLFQGFQPDYHLNETAIRHWDGYWFGKRRFLGDTFPHYWTALSGIAYLNTEDIVGSDKYVRRVNKTLRSVLSLFKEDGSASCAMVYPMSVNDQPAHFYDPWANDQDWGLYYMLKYGGI